jgi:hypothetical protein
MLCGRDCLAAFRAIRLLERLNEGGGPQPAAVLKLLNAETGSSRCFRNLGCHAKSMLSVRGLF